MVTRVRRSSPGPHLRLRPTRTLSETPRPHHGRGYGRCRRCGRTRRAHTCLQNRPEGGFAQAPTARQLLVDHTPEEPRGCTDATTCVQTSSLSRDRQHQGRLTLVLAASWASWNGSGPSALASRAAVGRAGHPEGRRGRGRVWPAEAIRAVFVGDVAGASQPCGRFTEENTPGWRQPIYLFPQLMVGEAVF